MKRGRLFPLLLCAVIASRDSAPANVKLGARVGGTTITLRWQGMPVRYFVSNRSGGGVTGAQLEQAVTRAFANWDALATAEITAQFAGVTSAGPVLKDGI